MYCVERRAPPLQFKQMEERAGNISSSDGYVQWVMVMVFSLYWYRYGIYLENCGRRVPGANVRIFVVSAHGAHAQGLGKATNLCRGPLRNSNSRCWGSSVHS